MSAISALFGTIILIVTFESLGRDLFYMGSMELKARFYVFLIFAYLIALVVAGWRYAIYGKRPSGMIHAGLMSGIAGLGLIWGFLASNVATGPGNPVGPEIQLTGLVAIVIGIIAAICAIGVAWKLYATKNRD